MKEFFQKYSVELDEMDALDLICETADEVKEIYDEDDEKVCLRKLAYLHQMIHDFFLSKDLMIESHKY